ncbi:hypothetical protein N7486_005330 [Penicillium sp. IBT 16267x]|nr:hypothetical protein N7486_005330 [Penicillium sp. IBT 16267x]
MPDTINGDILCGMMLASEGVMIQSELKIQDATCLESIMGTMEKIKNEKGGLEQYDDTWTYRAHNEIAAVYGLLGMTQLSLLLEPLESQTISTSARLNHLQEVR